MMNGQQYKESLKKLKPVIYCNGRKIESVVNDKMTAPHVNSAAMTYELAFQPEYEDLMTAVSSFTGKKINRFTHVHQSTDDLIKKVKMMRMIGQKTGTCYQRCGTPKHSPPALPTSPHLHADRLSRYARWHA